MRLFIAIPFNHEIITKIYSIENELKKDSKKGTFTRKENLHVTLAFLGEVSNHRIGEIENVVDTSFIKSFSILITEFGKFKNMGESIYWCGIQNQKHLAELQNNLVNQLKKAFFQVEDRPFKPHITLARRCVMNQGFDETQFSERIPRMEMLVDRISLMK